MKTKVIFRKWNNGGIIALFPELPGTNSPFTCSSYEHLGQHGGASPEYVIRSHSGPAKPEEYANLKLELERIGYDLQIVKRLHHSFLEARRKELAR